MKSLRTCLLAFLLLGASIQARADAPAETAVREAVIAFNRAYEANDLDAYFSYYAPDATLWMNRDFTPVASYRKDWTALVSSGGAVVGNHLSDLQVRAAPDGRSAVATYRLRVETRQPDGRVTREQAQETDVWFRTDDGWRVVHLHYAYEPAE